MAKNPGLSLLSLETANLDLTDVLSVVTSRAETKLHQELSDAKKAASDAKQRAKDLKTAKKKQARKEKTDAAKELAAKLRDAVESVGGKVTVNKLDDYEVLTTNDDGHFEHTVTVANSVRHSGSCRFAVTVEPSADFQELVTDLEEAQSVHDELQATAFEWRKRLANVPLLERRARAKLAEAKLAESEDGQAVLDTLTEGLEAEFLALPAN